MDKWQLRLFGGLQVVRGEQQIAQFPTKRSGLILARLALSRQAAVGRDELAETLWPEDFLDSTRVRLRQELKRLRETLGEAADILQSDRTWIRLDTDICEVDLRDFEHHLRQAKADGGRLPHLRAALDLYTGPLLPEFQEDWVVAARQELRSRALLARCEASNDLRSSNPSAALDEALAAVRQDPAYEPAVVALIRAFQSTGDGGGARRAFQEYDRLLQKERRSPSEAVRSLFEVAEPLDLQPEELVVPEPEAPSPSPLPTYEDSFHGRHEEVQTLREQVSPETRTRIVTIVGPAGVGKSRLAVEVAQLVASQFKAVSFVVADEEPLDGLPRRLEAAADQNGAALIVLDNVEPVVELVAEKLRPVLARYPRAKVLATSRQRIGVAGEQVYPLSVLPVPVTEVGESFGCVPSVQMFVERVRQLRPGYELDSGEELELSLLLARLDGLPLAIELAAARAASATIHDLSSQTDERFTWLTTRRNDLPLRQRSLWAAIDASYRSLPPDVAQAAKLLSLFHGGASPEAARGALGMEANDVLDELFERSMIHRVAAGTGTRYGMLDSIREFLRLQISEAELQDFSRRHAAVFAKLLFPLSRKFLGPDQKASYDEVEREYENGYAALRWSVSNDPELALELGAALWRFFCARSRPVEGHAILKLIPDMPGIPRGAKLGEVLFGVAASAFNQGDLDGAQRWFERSAAEFERTKLPHAVAWVHMNDAGLAEEQMDFERALARCESVKALRDSEGMPEYPIEQAMRASALANVGRMEEAVREMEGAFARRMRGDDPIESAKGFHELGMVYKAAGQHEKVAPLLEEAVQRLRDSGDQAFLIEALLNLIEVRMDEGKGVLELLNEADTILDKIRNPGKRSKFRLLQGRLRLAEGRRREAASAYMEAMTEAHKARNNRAATEAIQAAASLSRAEDLQDAIDHLRKGHCFEEQDRLIDQLIIRLAAVS